MNKYEKHDVFLAVITQYIAAHVLLIVLTEAIEVLCEGTSQNVS